MDDKIVSISILTRLPNFKIRSLADAKTFCDQVIHKGNTYQFPDANDPTMYHIIAKEKDGRVIMGSAHYGKDPLTAEVPCLDDENIVWRVWTVRKSINQEYFNDKN